MPIAAARSRRAPMSRATMSSTPIIRDHAESAYHPCGTCRMGRADDAMSVVDPECRVIGVDGLARRQFLDLPAGDQRQPQRAVDHDRREGRRPHPRQGAAGAVQPGAVDQPALAGVGPVRIQSPLCLQENATPETRMKAQPKASHYINGRFVDDDQGAELAVIYPATGETIAMLRGATPNIVELAVESARSAQPAWARLKPVERGRILRRAADILRARNAELARLETLDTGKAIQETLVADAPVGRRLRSNFWAARSPPSMATMSISAARSPIRAASRSASASASAPGTTRSRSPAGNPRRRSPWATPWCSSRPRTRRSRRWRWPRSTPRPACRTACSTSSRVLAMSAPRWSRILPSPRSR